MTPEKLRHRRRKRERDALEARRIDELSQRLDEAFDMPAWAALLIGGFVIALVAAMAFAG